MEKRARDRREATYRARTQVPSASRTERREDDPRGSAESALHRKRALAAKADQAEYQLLVKARAVKAHNARRKERSAKSASTTS